MQKNQKDTVYKQTRPSIEVKETPRHSIEVKETQKRGKRDLV